MYYDFLNNSEDKGLLKELGFEKISLKPDRITPKNSNELKQQSFLHQKSDFLVLSKSSLKLLELAVKNCQIDATDIFPNYIIFKAMAERNIAFIVNFNHILSSPDRAKTFYEMKKTVKLALKYKVPIILTSGANTYYEQRSASELIAFGELLKMSIKEAKNALYNYQKLILERNELKRQGKWVQPGIKAI